MGAAAALNIKSSMQFIKSVVRGVAIAFGVLFVLILIGALVAPSQEEAQHGVDQLYSSVAADYEGQYEMATRHGSLIDRCVQAGLVAAAYSQANNEESYADWKATEARDCQMAGVPW